MDLIPNDIINLILKYLNIREKTKFTMTSKKYLKFKPSIYFCLFINYTEDEGNIVSDFIAITISLNEAKKIINNFIKNDNVLIDEIIPFHNSMKYSNNFTYIGTRFDINNSNSNRRRYFRSNNGFIIEPIELNKIYKSGNI